jgi:hypothetical protein
VIDAGKVGTRAAAVNKKAKIREVTIMTSRLEK